MTLPSRHGIRNSNPGGLRSSTLPLGQGGSPQYWIITSERERNILFLWNLKARVGFEPAISDFLQAGRFNHCIRTPKKKIITMQLDTLPSMSSDLNLDQSRHQCLDETICYGPGNAGSETHSVIGGIIDIPVHFIIITYNSAFQTVVPPSLLFWIGNECVSCWAQVWYDRDN